MRVSKPRPGSYGHNRYDVYDGDRLVGTVEGGGDRRAVGRSIWWTATLAHDWHTSRYNTTRREAIAALARLDRENRA